MSNTASLKKEYAERIAPALKSQFQYSSTMQIPVLKKIVINQGLGMAVADKKIIEVAINEMWIEASCFTIPPCGFFAFGFVLLDTILIPSTIARPSLTRTRRVV